MTRRTRAVAWIVLVALAGYQAFANRYAVSPDGISYLDLSDAIVGGHLWRLVNLYWSPLYPTLVGVARLVGGASVEREVSVMHAANFVCFVGLLGAFEYMLMGLLELAARTPRSALRGPFGIAGAYALFGCFTLTMTSLELTTPDLLNGALSVAAFGALLRLDAGSTWRRRDAVVLGAALGLGALAKAFMVPWGAVCLLTAAVALRRHRWRPIAIAVAVWLVFVMSWTAVMTRAAGRPTFGDSGRLTYAWYVNGQDAPSLGGVPPGARRPATEMILPGVGVPADTAGSDPMWFDPARWNAAIAPHFRVREQLVMLKAFESFYVQNLTPLLFLFLLIAVAPRGSRRVVWQRGWIVYVPAIAGLGAYAMVIVTTRYVMPFILAATLTILATLPLPRRMNPTLTLLGLAIPIGLEAIDPQTAFGLALVTSVIGGMLAGVLTPTRRRALWVVAVTVGLMLTRVMLPASYGGQLRYGAVALALIMWRVALAAVRRYRTVTFSARALAAMGFLLAVVLLLRLGIRLNQDADALARASASRWGNVDWKIATDLRARGVGRGARIALVGPHAESYWVRAGGMHIVANVPANRVDAFWDLPRSSRDSLLAEFARSGATVAIASQGPRNGQPDGSWSPVRYRGWIRRLPATAR